MLKTTFAILVLLSAATSAEVAHAKLTPTESLWVQKGLEFYNSVETYEKLYRALRITRELPPESFKNPAFPPATDHLPKATLKDDKIFFEGVGDPVVIKDLKSATFTLRGQVIPLGPKIPAETAIKRIVEILERRSAMNLAIPQARAYATLLGGIAIGIYGAIGGMYLVICPFARLMGPTFPWRCVPEAMVWPAVLAYEVIKDYMESPAEQAQPPNSPPLEVKEIQPAKPAYPKVEINMECRDRDTIHLPRENLTITRVPAADKSTYQYSYSPLKPDFEKYRAKLDAAAAGLFALCPDPKAVQEMNEKLNQKKETARPKDTKSPEVAPH